MKLILVFSVALLLLATTASSTFVDNEAVEMESAADSIEEVALDPSIINLRRRDANEDEAVLKSFEEVASQVEATIAKPQDPEMATHLKALESLEAEVEAENEAEAEQNAFLEATPRGYSPELLSRVDEALRAHDTSFGIPDLAKPPVKKVFPRIGKGEKTLASDIPLAKIKDDIQPALNLKRSIISQAEEMAQHSKEFIAKWEKDNGGHWCKRPKAPGAAPCKAKPPLKKAPIPGAKLKMTKAQKKAAAKKGKKAAKKAKKAKKKALKKQKKAAKKAKKAAKKAQKKRRRRAGLLRRIGRKLRRM